MDRRRLDHVYTRALRGLTAMRSPAVTAARGAVRSLLTWPHAVRCGRGQVLDLAVRCGRGHILPMRSRCGQTTDVGSKWPQIDRKWPHSQLYKIRFAFAFWWTLLHFFKMFYFEYFIGIILYLWIGKSLRKNILSASLLKHSSLF